MDVFLQRFPSRHAGRVAVNLHGQGYISGRSLGDGTFFGRRAGTAAAQG